MRRSNLNSKDKDPSIEMCERIRMRALHLVNEYLKPLGISLESLPGFIDLDWSLGQSNNICEAVNIELCTNNFNDALPLLNQDQLDGFNTIVDAVKSNEQKTYFIDGPGGSGKTFLYSVLLNYLGSETIPCIPVASSGVVLLLKNGRTAHSDFKLSIPRMKHQSVQFLASQIWLKKIEGNTGYYLG